MCIRGSFARERKKKGRGGERRAQLAMLTRAAHARNTVFYNGPATSHVPIHRQSRRLFLRLSYDERTEGLFEMMGSRGRRGGKDCERFESFLTLPRVLARFEATGETISFIAALFDCN